MGIQTYEIPPILVSLFIVVYYIRLKHKERLEIIKKGDYAFETNYLRNLKYSVLSKGILLLSLAAGMGIGYRITLDMSGISQLVIYLICLLGSGGIGLLVYYFIIRKEE